MLPDAVLRTEKKLTEATREETDTSRTLKQIEKLRPLPYSELISLADFINDHTPFSTKHGALDTLESWFGASNISAFTPE
jgi:DNA helicase-2/ATP-dependent DNA helicase PcrA